MIEDTEDYIDALQVTNRQLVKKNAELKGQVKELIAENMSLYSLLADIREAAGDKEGRLMQDELVFRIKNLIDEVTAYHSELDRVRYIVGEDDYHIISQLLDPNHQWPDEEN